MDKEKITGTLSEDQKDLLKQLIDFIDILEKQISDLENLPHIVISKDDKTKQRLTPAGRLYKDRMNLYLQAIKTIATLTRRSGAEADDLLKALQDFAKEDDDE